MSKRPIQNKINFNMNFFLKKYQDNNILNRREFCGLTHQTCGPENGFH